MDRRLRGMQYVINNMTTYTPCRAAQCNSDWQKRPKAGRNEKRGTTLRRDGTLCLLGGTSRGGRCARRASGSDPCRSCCGCGCGWGCFCSTALLRRICFRICSRIGFWLIVVSLLLVVTFLFSLFYPLPFRVCICIRLRLRLRLLLLALFFTCGFPLSLRTRIPLPRPVLPPAFFA